MSNSNPNTDDSPTDETETDTEPDRVTPAEYRAVPNEDDAPAGGFELYRDAIGEWRWRFRVQNGNIIAESGEGYVRRIDAVSGIKRLEQEIHAASILDLTKDQSERGRLTRLRRRFADLADTAARRSRGEPPADTVATDDGDDTDPDAEVGTGAGEQADD